MGNANMIQSFMGQGDEMTANQWWTLFLSCSTVKDKTCQSVKMNEPLVTMTSAKKSPVPHQLPNITGKQEFAPLSVQFHFPIFYSN